MTYIIRLMIFSVLIASLSACEREPVEKTVWDDQIDTLDKAREVEEKLMNRADQLEKDLKDLEGNDPPQ